MNTMYSKLNRVPFLKKSYTLKFLFIAFLGIHIPLIGLIAYFINSPNLTLSKTSLIILVLVFTLIAAASTLIILKRLLSPLIHSKKALEDYLFKNKLPELPLYYVDEAGTLMSLIQRTIYTQDTLIKEKQEITTLVSHNLRTPLNQIKGLCEIMKHDDEDKLPYIEKISKIAEIQLESLSNLLNQLMYKDQKSTTVEEEYNLNEIIAEEISMVEISLITKKIKLIFENKERINLTKVGKNKIALVIQNLISNAIKFSFEGGKIIIGVKKVGLRTEVYVKDYGIGFSDDYKKLLFKDARNIGRKGTKNEPSVGLGLHLCKRTINQLGGDLTANSDGENKGATFTILI